MALPSELFWRFVTGITPEERKKLIDKLPTSSIKDIGPDEEIDILKRAVNTAPEQMQKAMESWGKKPANASWMQGQGIGGMLKGLAGNIAEGAGTALGVGQQAQRAPLDLLTSAAGGIWNWLQNRPPTMESVRGPIPGEGEVVRLMQGAGMSPEEEQPITQPEPQPTGGLGAILDPEFWKNLQKRRGIEQ